MKNFTWASVAAWIATGIAVVVALVLTKDPRCLFAFILPAGLEIGDFVQKKEVEEEEK